MIKHVRYNYRTDKDGKVYWDWFTVGESFKFQLNEVEDIELTVVAIRLYDEDKALVECKDADGNPHDIEQTGITTNLRWQKINE
jgi:hypothetical protein